MWRNFCSLFKKDCQMMIAGKFFLLAFGSFLLYTLFINLGYIKFMNAELYHVYLYDPQGTQTQASDRICPVASLEELDQALAADTTSVGIDASSGAPDVILYYGSEKVDRHRADYARLLLQPDNGYTAKTVGINTPELKQRKEITCELLFIEIVAVGFLGIASALFKEKQMGVIRVHAVLPLKKSLFILSKIIIFLSADLIFAVLLTVFNIGIADTVHILPAVLVQTVILSLIMALVGFGCTMVLNDFKQFSLAYLVIAIFAAAPVFLAANTSIKMAWIGWHPFYQIYMGLKNAYFETPVTDPVYYICSACGIAALFIIVQTAFRKEMGGVIMGGLIYQLKSVGKDKFCIMSFLLPLIVAFMLNFVGTIDLSTLSEFHFGIVQDNLPAGTISWLERYGSVTEHKTREDLIAAVNDPSTNLIGVEAEGDGIQTMLSGDEMDLWRQTADTLPGLYRDYENPEEITVTILERPDLLDSFQNIFIAITLIVAMFMGCTFNAVNIIEEKESGVALVNQVLPMTQSRYIIQKIFVGFVCGGLSAVFTAGICFRLSIQSAFFMLALIILSAFTAALIGLFIGEFAENLMVGVVYIKVALILFIAVPLLSWLLGADGLALIFCNLIPSHATFEGIMSLAGGAEQVITKDILILMAHGIVWFLLYLTISKRKLCAVL